MTTPQPFTPGFADAPVSLPTADEIRSEVRMAQVRLGMAPERDQYRERNRALTMRKLKEAKLHRHECQREGDDAMVAALDAVIAGHSRALQDLDNPGTPGWLAVERARERQS